MTIWSTMTLDVVVDYDDFMRAHEKALERGDDCERISVPAEVDVDDALDEMDADQLREALGREEPGYTPAQLDAIQEAFAAAARGDMATALALATRIFDHWPQVSAAEKGLRQAAPARLNA